MLRDHRIGIVIITCVCVQTSRLKTFDQLELKLEGARGRENDYVKESSMLCSGGRLSLALVPVVLNGGKSNKDNDNSWSSSFEPILVIM